MSVYPVIRIKGSTNAIETLFLNEKNDGADHVSIVV